MNFKISKIILYLLLFFLLVPLFVLVIWSFSNSWPWPNMLPKDLGIRAYKHIFSFRTGTLGVLIYSIILSATVTLITIIISIPASKALGVYDFPLKKLFKILVLAPIIVPPVAVAMGIHVSFIKMGLANTFLGVVLVHLIPCIPYGVRIITSVFEGIGEKMEIQAKVLGASSLQTFFHITLPMITPGVISAASMVFIVSFSQYFLTFLIGGGKVKTLSLVMFPYIQSGDRMMASAYSIVFSLTTLMILLIMEKSIKKKYKRETDLFV
ncbi:ABC transporter permease subunit [Clostridium sp. D2Q-11]|uniref:ABC transporter permease subunit n=1 Tax=Anaeromonas frigoriresistens TaxID=2683708 RepID=A0A942Z889_9FIRM|nr:ABC transporter permease subunit [Anaeromonas frigoriresistens]MBS4538043.1 ABC transporter permease subunit [Anaeromonas frigoriresistens]